MGLTSHPIGSVFARLTVIGLPSQKGRYAYVRCRCECGKEIDARPAKLASGHTRSCGCLRAGPTSRRACKHGLSRSPEYHAWAQMIARCHRHGHPESGNYGERGISVCERWRTGFEAFYADMGPRPSPYHSLDRIDNNAGYSPENCRWATRKEQNRNTRYNVLLSYEGRTLCLAAWAEERGISAGALWWRLHRDWPLARALGFER